jgi:hypothetical protein
MTLVEKSLEQMLQEIQFQTIWREDVIVLGKFPECPRPSAKSAHNLSAPLVDFLWKHYDGDTEIADHISQLEGRKNGRSLISFALENAILWGNRNNPDLPVAVKVYDGHCGVVVQIKDSGKGFDYREKTGIVKGLRSEKLLGQHGVPDKNGRKYYRRKGGGFSTYEWHPSEVAFEGKGNVLNILYKFST